MTDIISQLNAALTGRYELERQIGQGGMATVYLARDVRHGRKVAIKIIHPELAAVLGPERFVTEMRVTANLQHPHILPLFDSGTADGQLFYVMPFVEGESLRQRLEREQQLPIDVALRLATEVAGALDYAHRHGVVHRDIKPENILLHDGSALVADFGIALAVSNAGGTRLTQTGLSLGTPQYMSPEQATGDKKVDGRTDIYSLACVLYEMLLGEPPFTGPNSQSIVAQMLTESVRPLRTRRATIAPGVESAVLKALAKLPADRFDTPHKFAVALVDGRVETSATQPLAARSRRVTAAVAVAAALAVSFLGFAAGKAAGIDRSALTYSGSILDGPSIAVGPKFSPDGKMVAFAGLIGHQSQIGVLNPATGDWRILTNDTTLGAVSAIAWSADNSRIYYARAPDIAVGIYSMSALGGDNRLVLPNASIAAALSDGTLIVSRALGQREQFARFYPQTGKLDTLPGRGNLIVFTSMSAALPGEREFMFRGSLSETGGMDTLYAVDLQTHATRVVTTGMTTATALVVEPGEKSFLLADRSGDETVISRIRFDDVKRRVALFSVPGTVYAITTSAGGDVLLDQYVRPTHLLQYNIQTGRVDLVAPRMTEYWGGAWLMSDGRMILPRRSGGKTRAVIASRSGETAPFLPSDEWVLPPAVALGTDRIMLRAQTDSGSVLTITNVRTGQTTGRIPRFNSTDFAGSPDGSTIFFAEASSIWAMPSQGGERRRLHEGTAVAVDPLGRYLIIMLVRDARTRLIRYSLPSGAVTNIEGQGPATPISAHALTSDGKLVMPVSTASSWYWLLGVLDINSGKLATYSLGYDIWDAAWAPDGSIAATGMGIESRIWRFRPNR